MEPEHKAAHEELARRSEGNRQRLLELIHEYNNLAMRVHKLEDAFDTKGIIDEMAASLYTLAANLEILQQKFDETIKPK